MFETQIETCHVKTSLLLSEFSVKKTKARIGKLWAFSETYKLKKIEGKFLRITP